MIENILLNQDGCLDAGIHRMNISEFKTVFIKNFPSSKTRDKIFSAFHAWCIKLLNNYHVYEIWIDGSYVTDKVNPNDIDCVVFFYADGYLQAAPNWASIVNIPEVDGYYTLAICKENEAIVSSNEYNEFINNRNYWRGQFGFDRNDQPKGIVAITPEGFVEGGE